MIMVVLIGFECMSFRRVFITIGSGSACPTVIIGVRYFLMWKHISRVFPLAERKTSPSLCIRVALFNLYSVIVLRYAFPDVCTLYRRYWFPGFLSASIFFISDIESPWPYMVQAARKCLSILKEIHADTLVLSTFGGRSYLWHRKGRFQRPLHKSVWRDNLSQDLFLVWCFWRRKPRLGTPSDSFAGARRLSRLSNMELPSSLRLSGTLSEHTVVWRSFVTPSV